LIDRNTDTYNAILEAKCGWVVNPEAKNQIIEKFKELVRIPKSESTRRGLNGYNYAIENFSKTKNLDKLISIIID
jgi:glycosyltransferase involved in cell wall biosynthesis